VTELPWNPMPVIGVSEGRGDALRVRTLRGAVLVKRPRGWFAYSHKVHRSRVFPWHAVSPARTDLLGPRPIAQYVQEAGSDVPRQPR